VLATINNLGVGYLCVGEPEKAQKLFREAIAINPEVEAGYHWLGVAQWISREFKDAVTAWVASLDCSYRDAAGGMQTPLILYYAACCQPELYPLSRALHLISERSTSPHAKLWPGPLGSFLLQKLDAETLRQYARSRTKQRATRYLAQAAFYTGVAAFASGDVSAFLAAMRDCAIASQSESLLERYLARHELLIAEQ
jgi:lipoprotein NlpI